MYETTKTRRRLTADQQRPMTKTDLLPDWRSWDRAYELHIDPRRWDGNGKDWPLKFRWRAYLAVVNGSRRLRGVTR